VAGFAGDFWVIIACSAQSFFLHLFFLRIKSSGICRRWAPSRSLALFIPLPSLSLPPRSYGFLKDVVSRYMASQYMAIVQFPLSPLPLAKKKELFEFITARLSAVPLHLSKDIEQ